VIGEYGWGHYFA